MSGSAYTVRIVGDLADREAAFAVRKEVFVGEQGVPEDLEYDAFDEPGADAVHLLAVRDDGLPLGTGRLLYGPTAADRTGGDTTVGSLGRLAVTAHARGLGVGVALVRAIEDVARARGLTAVDLHAQTRALGFYEGLGYEAYGPEYPEAGIPHRAMRRAL
ncbi:MULTISPECIES: GNAT family N-acetyltransferase [Streptomyces]|uniref:GNAT family N-acetyltransferase n=1 Tax=Streptomyces doudnae TaxID=3075536 RepID=A0ABD5EN91_9ACTN|nr:MULTISPECIES: GNAT family N-acetyltransferase [unclassified Streptomyces]MDT0435320.1 GNAT family N-acetyltransferase [Streptomyces sp. DSM 41981]MYQ66486.1 GNAT family N-acetyltransferase [Streptomyces sp. SID4950]SCE21049.1 Predicted N-acyltransferase, GNAT family [Streptomyces sp. SolWspMP-5a-2]